MNLELKQLFDSAEGRYFNDLEAARLGAYADGLLGRLAMLAAVERAEPQILDHVCRAVLSKYPTMPGRHGPQAEQFVRRDQAMVLRYAAFSWLMLDPNFIHDKLAVWLRTILHALCEPAEVAFGYQKLIEACQIHLTSQEAEGIIPYLRIVLDELGRTKERKAS